MSNKRAFSLIELMVVITIVGVLAAISIPTYSTYAVKSEVSALWPVMESFHTKMKNYYLAHGRFPQASDLGLGTNYVVPNASNYGNHIVDIHIFNNHGNPTCSGGIVIVLSGSSLGIDVNNAWGYGGGPNHIAWASYLYVQNDNIKVICGTKANANDDYKYLPANCQNYHPMNAPC